MIMYNQQNITQYYTDDFERKMLDRSYQVLINQGFSVNRKLTAVEFLSSFIHIEEHKKRLEILRDREPNPRVRKHIEKALDGTVFDHLKKAFMDFEAIDRAIEGEFKEDQKRASLESRVEISSNLPFLRYQARALQDKDLG